MGTHWGTAATATGLTAGTYTVTVTDANSCTATQSFTITEPTTLTATPSAQTNVSCNGGANGSATVAVTGASGYTYFGPSGGTAATATGLTAGTYTVTVTDANSCTTTQSFTITEPTALVFTTATLPNYVYNSSYLETVVATGGTGTITYTLASGSLPSGFTLSSNGVITGTSTQLTDSNFAVTATDANNCSATANFTLRSSQIPITVTASVSQNKVYGDSDPVLTYTAIPSLLPGDTFTGALARDTGEDVGNYTIDIGSLSAGDNYSITFISDDFTITAKPITVTADALQTKVYGTTDPTFTYTVNGFVNGDDQRLLTGELTRVLGENTGLYAIGLGTLSAGANYSLDFETSDFEITKADQQITWNQELYFGCSTSDPIALLATSNSGLPVAYHISDATVAAIIGNDLIKNNPGTAQITASQAGDQNHNPATNVINTVTVGQMDLIRQHWEDVLVFDNGSENFVGWQWYKNGVAISGATGQFYNENATLNGKYHVVATTKNGQEITSCSLDLSGKNFSREMRIHPNPVRPNSQFTIECSLGEPALNGATINIFDLTGKLLQTSLATGTTTQLTAPGQTGIYVVSLILANGDRKTANLLVD
ncbi:MAG: MBG domain-containing protein [Flavobacteriaceae bacterium]